MSYSFKLARFQLRIIFLTRRFILWLKGCDTEERQSKRQEEVSVKTAFLVDYFARKYMPSVNRLTQKQITVENPETIWQFWDNPVGQTTPDIVNASIRTVEKFKGNFKHKVLNNSTIGDYSDLPGYVFDRLKNGKMIYAHFADLLRLNLLKNHGGVWMDATLYMTDFIPKYIIDSDFFVFLTGNLTHYSYSFMQNFFIRAKKGSFLCEAWEQMGVEYWKKEYRAIDYFQHQIMFKTLVFKHPPAQKLFAEMPYVNEDEVLQFVDSLFTTFDANEWDRIKKISFLQKTTYKIPDIDIYQDTYFSKLSEGKL